MSPEQALAVVLGGAVLDDLAGITTRWVFGPVDSFVTWARDLTLGTGFAEVKTQLLIDMGFITAEDVTA